MKKKVIGILSVAVIAVGAIGGGIAFAANNEAQLGKQDTVQTKVVETTHKDRIYNTNSENNPSKDIFKDMIKLMRDNDFKDMARYMQTGDYEAMDEFMNNISQEDYDTMIEIMNNNEYGYMGQMMESIGREGMIQMHNSMSSMHGTNGGSNNMMDGF